MSIARPSAAANAVASVLLLVFSLAVMAAVVLWGSGPLLWTTLAAPVVLGLLGVVGLVDVRWPRRAGEHLRSGACQVAGGLLLVSGVLLDLARADWTYFDDALAISGAGGLLLTMVGVVRLARARRRSTRCGPGPMTDL